MELSLVNSAVSNRVELQKMKIVRPPADVARYTMVFHKRDSGNAINKDRSVAAETAGVCSALNESLRTLHLFIDSFMFASQDEAVGTNSSGVEEGRTEQLLV